MAFTLFECKKCLAIIAGSLTLIQASYGALESLQSSLNHDKGTTSLALLFSFYMLSALLLPPVFISKIGCKKTLASCLFVHALYIAANFYPKPLIFYPASILLGIAAGVLTASTIIYTIHVSQAYALLQGKTPSHYTKLFFGIGFAFVNFGAFSGNLFMSILLKSFESAEKQPDLDLNGTTVRELGWNETVILPVTTTMLYNSSFSNNSECGLYYDMKEKKNDSKTSVPQHILHTLLGVYLVLSLIPAVLCMFLKDIDNEQLTDKSSPKNQEEEESLNASKAESSLMSKCDSIASINVRVSNKKSTFSLLKSTLKLLAKDKVALLVVSHTIHVGVLKAFSRSVFNAAWISCWLGIQSVGYVMATYSIVLTVVSFVSGYILKVLSFEVLFGLVMLVELSICGTLYFWRPGNDDTVMYYIVMGLFACCYGIVKTQTPSAYDKLFPDRREQAAALQGVMEAVGLSVMFGLSGAVDPIISLSVFLVWSCLGCVLFIFACLIKDKECRYWSCFSKPEGHSKGAIEIGDDNKV